MKIPKFVIRIGYQSYVIAKKEGIGALVELLAEAIPVNSRLHRDPPEIELTYIDEPDMLQLLQQVECVRIPANVVWTQKTKDGEVHVVRPAAKAPKALKAPKAKALPAPKRKALPPASRPALPAPSDQLTLI